MSYLTTYRRLNQLYGAAAATYILGASVLRRMGYLRYACYARDSVASAPHSVPPGFTIRAVDANEVGRWAPSPEMDMSTAFAAGLKEGKDYAVAAYASGSPDTLPAAYGFLSLGDTAVDDRWILGLPGDGAYVYKTFTRESFRGRGLNKACCSFLMALPQTKGRRVLTLIEASNVASRRSFEAVGFVTKGNLLTWSNGACAKLTPGARKAGLRLLSG